jgi:heme A synthase
MTASPAWTTPALRYLGPTLVLLLVVEALLGGWTNVSGPSTFTTSTSLPSLMGHEGLGYLLGVLALVALVAAAMAGRRRNILHAGLVLVGVGAAGVAGRAFLQNSSNPPIDSTVMALMFLVALAGAIGMTVVSWRSAPANPPETPRVATG